ERAPTRVTDERERGRRAAGTPVEHVRTQCPVLIATLVAMARASKDGRNVDDSAAAAAPPGPPGCARYPVAGASPPPAARWQERLGDPRPNRRPQVRPTGGRA